MPIYAYRCDECGFSKDVLQKISDPVLTDCVSCGKPAFKKQLTAAGFQLKGTGWYVTDFRGGKVPATGAAPGAVAGAPSESSAAPAASSSDSAPAAAPAAGTVAKAGGTDTSKT